MALSTALKNLMLAGRKISYRLKIELKNDDDAWIDFSDRDPVLRQVRLSTEKNTGKIVSSIGYVSFKNVDGYFDYMDDPGHSDTTTLFSTLATKFSKGFRGVLLRGSLVFSLEDGSFETAPLGIYKITDVLTGLTKRADLKLAQDVDFLKIIGTQSMSDGYRQFNNRPVSFLVREILSKIYAGGVTASDFTIPDKIYLTTSDGEPALSHYGKPPELDTDGRWRNDVTDKPGAIYYHAASGYFYVGIGRECWRMDPDEETWDLCGIFGGSVQIKGFYEMSSTWLLVIGWEYSQTTREQVLKTAQLSTAGGSMVTNDPSNDTDIYSGEAVLRDTYHDGGSGLVDLYVGRISNHPTCHDIDRMAGLNMPCPFPQWPHSGALTYIAAVDGLRAEPASGDWSGNQLGATAPSPCYLAAGNAGTASATVRALFRVGWGMRPSICSTATFALGTLADTPYVFVVETDGNPLGIRCTGQVRITGYYAYAGTNRQISTGWISGARAPMYDLRYFINSAGSDALSFINIDWVEEYIDADPGSDDPANCDNPIAYIRAVTITDDGSGNPEVNLGSTTTFWSSADDVFATDDSGFIPTHAFPVKPSGTNYWLVQTLDIDAVGDKCFELFIADGSINNATSLGTAMYGWDNFTYDDTNEVFYFTNRDTGQLCKLDISGTPLSAAIEILCDGGEVAGKDFFGLPQATENQLVLRTESSKVCLYGIGWPYLASQFFEDAVWPPGNFWLWKYHFDLTDRIELFDEGELTAWQALGQLAEVVDYQVGVDPEGVGFFSPLPTSADASEFTLDLDGAAGLHFTVKKTKGYPEIINRSQFIPYEVSIGLPKASLDLRGYTEDGDEDPVYFNGETEVKSESILETNISLACVIEGDPGTAEFKYLIHETLIEATLREATTISSFPRRIRLDNNADIEVGQLVQIGDVDEESGTPYEITTIESDGDVVLNQDLTADFEIGTSVLLKSNEKGVWSTDYDTPATYTTAETFVEIGTTGIFLRFTPDDDPKRFVVGDRVLVENPGQELRRSRTHKFTVEDTESRDKWGVSELNFNNQYLSFTLGKERSKNLVTDRKDPHYYFTIKGPLLLQAKPLTVFTIKSRKLLPLATDNEEKVYVQRVTNTIATAETVIIARAISSY